MSTSKLTQDTRVCGAPAQQTSSSSTTTTQAWRACGAWRGNTDVQLICFSMAVANYIGSYVFQERKRSMSMAMTAMKASLAKLDKGLDAEASISGRDTVVAYSIGKSRRKKRPTFSFPLPLNGIVTQRCVGR